ncbi:hypothetical protein [Streptococcus pluranimalium]|uniref:hypothetical protein n=1 Tax=Streptococcus pluranimalium TaxID=82348 RepID=UPI003F693698
MANKIFKKTSNWIINRVILNIEKYHKQNDLPLYALLYSKENQQIIDDNGDTGEPYYSFSKKTSTETMSRILKRKGKITDKVAQLIAENMGTTYPKLIWGVHEKGLTLLDLLSYEIFWISVFQDALLSPKYRYKVIKLFNDYIPFARFIARNKIGVIDDEERLEELLNSTEFGQIMSEATRRFLILADISMRYEDITVPKLYITYFLEKENSLKNLSKTIEQFFDYCYEEYFQYVIDAYGDDYGLAAYQLLEKCTEMTLVEYKMNQIDYDVNLLEERVDKKDEEWILKKELVIATYNFVDTLASYQKQIEEVKFKNARQISFE